MNKTLVLGALALALVSSTAAFADTSGKRIALSNNYAGNSWRQAMLTSWDKTTKQAVADGIVAAADAFTTAETQATEQAAQIQNLILQGYDAIIVNAASPTALNGAIKEACDAGIIVVSFDGIVTEPCAWRITVDFKGMGKSEVDFLKTALPKGGKVLEIRGMAGVLTDDDISAGIHAGVAENPQFEIVGSVHGDWAQDVAQKAVAGILPSLPQDIVAVVTQGGDGYGAAQAFAAAGRPTPLIIMGNRQDELLWWKQQKDANGYTTMSTSIAPGVATLAFWITQQILDGVEVPKDVTVPLLNVSQDNLEKLLEATPVGGVANTEYTQDEAKAVIAATKG